MVDRAAPREADPPGVRRCPFRRQGHIQRCSEAAATDRLAPSQCGTRSAAPQRPRPDAEIDGAEVSWIFLPGSAVRKTTSHRLLLASGAAYLCSQCTAFANYTPAAGNDNREREARNRLRRMLHLLMAAQGAFVDANRRKERGTSLGPAPRRAVE